MDDPVRQRAQPVLLTLWWGMVKVTLSKANATAIPQEGILAMTCISNQCEILVMTRIMRNIGDDAHFQEMRK